MVSLTGYWPRIYEWSYVRRSDSLVSFAEGCSQLSRSKTMIVVVLGSSSFTQFALVIGRSVILVGIDYINWFTTYKVMLFLADSSPVGQLPISDIPFPSCPVSQTRVSWASFFGRLIFPYRALFEGFRNQCFDFDLSHWFRAQLKAQFLGLSYSNWLA